MHGHIKFRLSIGTVKLKGKLWLYIDTRIGFGRQNRNSPLAEIPLYIRLDFFLLILRTSAISSCRIELLAPESTRASIGWGKTGS